MQLRRGQARLPVATATRTIRAQSEGHLTKPTASRRSGRRAMPLAGAVLLLGALLAARAPGPGRELGRHRGPRARRWPIRSRRLDGPRGHARQRRRADARATWPLRRRRAPCSDSSRCRPARARWSCSTSSRRRSSAASPSSTASRTARSRPSSRSASSSSRPTSSPSSATGQGRSARRSAHPTTSDCARRCRSRSADIPERSEPLDGLSAIVWADDSSALSEAQRRAMERWVASGGQLVVDRRTGLAGAHRGLRRPPSARGPDRASTRCHMPRSLPGREPPRRRSRRPPSRPAPCATMRAP